MLKQVRVAIGLGVILSLGSALFLWIKPQGIGRVPEENARNVAHFEPLPRGAMRAAAFSIHAYERDTQAYLSQVVPGRAFQVQSPRPGLASIQAVSSLVPTVRALGNVELAVSCPAGAPVTFTSVGLGRFPNERTSITVAAGDGGVARTLFRATRGTVGRAIVLVASPLASGQVRFYVEIKAETDAGSRGDRLKKGNRQ